MLLSKRLLLIILFLMISATGCTVNQSDEVQIYRHVLDDGRHLEPESYNPKEALTLKKALALANAKNEQLAIAGENYVQALIDKDRAFANFLPTISFLPTYMRQEKSNIGAGEPLISEILRPETQDYPIEANLRFDPLKDVPGMKAAGFQAMRQRELLLDYKSLILIDVAQAYYHVLQSEQRLDVLKHSVAVDTQRLHDIEVQEKAGFASYPDVLQAASQLSSSKNSLIQAQDDINRGRALLAQLMGVVSVEAPLSDSFQAPKEEFQIDRLLRIADDNRPDLKAVNFQIDYAARLLESAWAEYFPSVSLNLTYFLSRQSFPNDVNWTGLIQANIPIFTAGLAHADVRTAYSRLRQAKLTESYMRKKVANDLNVILQDLKGDEVQVDQTRIQLEAAMENLHKAEVAYIAGAGTNLERLIAKNEQLKYELALTERVFKRNVDYLRLRRAAGITATNPDINFYR